MLTRRHFAVATAAVLGAGAQVGAAWAGSAASAAQRRLGAAALRALPGPLIAVLAAEGQAEAGEDLSARAAADYRAARTLRLEGVLLSRAEVARAVHAVQSPDAAIRTSQRPWRG